MTNKNNEIQIISKPQTIEKTLVRRIIGNRVLAVYSIINKYFWKTKIAPIFSLLITTISMSIYCIVGYTLMDDITFLIQGLPLYSSLCIVPLALITLPAMNIEFKNSILLRKIKTNGINALQYNSISISYYFLIALAMILYVLVLLTLFCCTNIDALSQINWGTYFYGLMMLIFSSLSLGSVMSSFIKNPIVSQLTGCLLLIFTAIFDGQFLPIYILSSVDTIKIIALFLPLTYASDILNVAVLDAVATSSNSIFDFTNDFIVNNTYISLISGTSNSTSISSLLDPAAFPVTIYYVWEKIVYAFTPFLITACCIGISMKYFKWSGR